MIVLFIKKLNKIKNIQKRGIKLIKSDKKHFLILQKFSNKYCSFGFSIH